jgi:membrane-associated phospholipid phosphatase
MNPTGGSVDSRWRALLLRVPPTDRTVGALLILAVVVAAVRLPVDREPLLQLLLLHLGLLAGFVVCVAAMIRWEQAPWVQFLRPLVTVAVIFELYSSLGRLGLTAMPYSADALLGRMDTRIFGVNPTFAIEPFLTRDRVEFFAFAYGAFIPYINVTIALNCLGRPPVERDQFLTGWVFTYALSYLGYIFIPARGPGYWFADEYQSALQGGFFYDVVQRGVEQTGGWQGAFPSLHVAGSLYLCLFELRTNRLRGLIFLPLVVLIYGATVVLRYHYVVDLIVGTVVAVICLPVGRMAFLAWARQRQAAGLPALPGGERDVLRAFPPAGPAHAGSVLQAH